MILNLREYEKYQLWRKRNKVKIKDVAKYIGCATTTISNYENGHSNMSEELVEYYDEFIDKFGKGLIKL